jgi:hypothetical protein
MNVDWQSHTNNIGHESFPGCFRCHDGKHLSQDNQAIRLECNICHSVPLVADPGKPIPPIEVSTAKEPATHKSTTWLAEHRYKFDATCAQCHTVDNPGGKDNSSFCSDSACHANKWVYAGLDAPKVRQLSAPPKVPGTGVPNPIPHPVGQRTDCSTCHAAGKVRPFPENHASFKMDMCTQCHKPTVQEAAAPAATPAAAPTATRLPAPTAAAAAATVAPSPTAAAPAAPQATATSAAAGGPPAIPHVIDDPVHKDCTLCHGEGKVKPFPANHTSFAVDMCTNCHKPAQQGGAGSAATAAPTSTVEAGATAAPAATTASAAAAATPTTAAAASPTAAAVPAGGLPAIPHDLAGRDNCLLCHNPDGGVKPAPKDHAGRSNELCQGCHKPKS